jgi:hypothetical protein
LTRPSLQCALRFQRQQSGALLFQRQQSVYWFCGWKDALAAEIEHCDCTCAVYLKAAALPLEVMTQALLAGTVPMMLVQSVSL